MSFGGFLGAAGNFGVGMQRGQYMQQEEMLRRMEIQKTALALQQYQKDQEARKMAGQALGSLFGGQGPAAPPPGIPQTQGRPATTGQPSPGGQDQGGQGGDQGLTLDRLVRSLKEQGASPDQIMAAISEPSVQAAFSLEERRQAAKLTNDYRMQTLEERAAEADQRSQDRQASIQERAAAAAEANQTRMMIAELAASTRVKTQGMRDTTQTGIADANRAAKSAAPPRAGTLSNAERDKLARVRALTTEAGQINSRLNSITPPPNKAVLEQRLQQIYNEVDSLTKGEPAGGGAPLAAPGGPAMGRPRTCRRHQCRPQRLPVPPRRPPVPAPLLHQRRPRARPLPRRWHHCPSRAPRKPCRCRSPTKTAS